MATGRIVSGTGTYAVSGTVAKNGDTVLREASATGTSVFNGDGTTTINVSGTAYIIDLTTGKVQE